jgi:hypothetical protein
MKDLKEYLNFESGELLKTIGFFLTPILSKLEIKCHPTSTGKNQTTGCQGAPTVIL